MRVIELRAAPAIRFYERFDLNPHLPLFSRCFHRAVIAVRLRSSVTFRPRSPAGRCFAPAFFHPNNHTGHVEHKNRQDNACR
ncbi:MULTISPECIES: hypothetical protein [Paraburkholderia]|uniref:hypothetical protein n=1 Tax=Paraburkholderia TaxID=1822464 RepID=UPI001595FCDA|nr:hypothetical protein [Paraburkholderia youngii]